MKTIFFKNANDDVFGLDVHDEHDESYKGYIQKDWVEIAENDAISIANPPKTPEQKRQYAEIVKKSMIEEASRRIDVLQDTIDFDLSHDGDAEKLKSWRRYRVLVSHVDTSLDDIKWPAAPEEI